MKVDLSLRAVDVEDREPGEVIGTITIDIRERMTEQELIERYLMVASKYFAQMIEAEQRS